MASSNSPCAACKFLRRKCTQECVFAPYFPPDQPQKFANVHKVFGASNVAKLLNELNPAQREDAVNSLAYEAETRLRDPVYGCVGIISILQSKLKQVQNDLYNAKKELSTYIGPSAMQPLILHQAHHPQMIQHHGGNIGAFGMSSMGLCLPSGPAVQSQLMLRDPQHQQLLEAQQFAVAVAAREQQELMRSYEQQQQELVRYNAGFDGNAVVAAGGGGFNHMSAAMPSSMAMVPFDNPFQLQQPHTPQPQEEHQPHQQQIHSPAQPLQQRTKSEEGTSVGPS
ncbi:hypothetical protein IFM89_002803 [Coptis chinensis]|uniref:LOB domain-containing protein n=1 Tax=Coptis chinensis TaxID=261450 RepID=A0A835HTP4_9MAGN|nr:hypothetical protein IFM89_002803 [Coptis chinensis]